MTRAGRIRQHLDEMQETLRDLYQEENVKYSDLGFSPVGDEIPEIVYWRVQRENEIITETLKRIMEEK